MQLSNKSVNSTGSNAVPIATIRVRLSLSFHASSFETSVRRSTTCKARRRPGDSLLLTIPLQRRTLAGNFRRTMCCSFSMDKGRRSQSSMFEICRWPWRCRAHGRGLHIRRCRCSRTMAQTAPPLRGFPRVHRNESIQQYSTVATGD